MIMFDVGAKNGEDFIDFKGTVYAFEPQKDCFDTIVVKTADNPNYHIHNVAIDMVPGTRTINRGQDNGVTSLNELQEGPWNEIGFSRFIGTEEVECIRLDDFIDENGIDKIDYLHVDTQGHDIIVLKSLGSHLNKVLSGCIECAWNENGKLYKTSPILEDCVYWLTRNGFVITEVSPNDPHNFEANIFFCNKDLVDGSGFFRFGHTKNIEKNTQL